MLWLKGPKPRQLTNSQPTEHLKRIKHKHQTKDKNKQILYKKKKVMVTSDYIHKIIYEVNFK